MQIVTTVTDVRLHVADARRERQTIGFVPTMGALHAGHLALIDRAREECGFVVVSIFVNPLQFGPNEDLDNYPRTLERDEGLCTKHGVDLVFVPNGNEVYPRPMVISVKAGALGGKYCGASRPGHFDGVCTVVCKLLNIVTPDRAYFGEKDYQQLVIVTRMTRDLNMPLEIIGCPIVREPDGLAMSSRNTYLSADMRRQASSIHAALCEARGAWSTGTTGPADICSAVSQRIAGAGGRVDYVAVVDAETLDEFGQAVAPERGARILVAAYFGGTRLIDNVRVDK